MVFFVSSLLCSWFVVFLRCYQHKKQALPTQEDNSEEEPKTVLFGVIVEGKKGGLLDLSSKLP